MSEPEHSGQPVLVRHLHQTVAGALRRREAAAAELRDVPAAVATSAAAAAATSGRCSPATSSPGSTPRAGCTPSITWKASRRSSPSTTDLYRWIPIIQDLRERMEAKGYLEADRELAPRRPGADPRHAVRRSRRAIEAVRPRDRVVILAPDHFPSGPDGDRRGRSGADRTAHAPVLMTGGGNAVILRPVDLLTVACYSGHTNSGEPNGVNPDQDSDGGEVRHLLQQAADAQRVPLPNSARSRWRPRGGGGLAGGAGSRRGAGPAGGAGDRSAGSRTKSQRTPSPRARSSRTSGT